MKRKLLPFFSSLSILAIILILASCAKDIDRLPYQVDDIWSEGELEIVGKYLDIDKFTYIRNVTSPEQYKIFLGRVLFYDNHLSADKSVSCESCHRQELAFSDDVAFSRGASGNVTERNSIALASFASFSGHYGGDGPQEDPAENSFFWDGRADLVEEQLTQTFANPNEMGMKLLEIGQRVNELEYAKIIYEKAFPNQPVTSAKVIQSIAAFVNTIKSTQSEFDISLARENAGLLYDFQLFSSSENRGKKLFLDNCAGCHAFSLAPIFRSAFRNEATAASNGLDVEYADKGLGSHTQLVEDMGVFKIPGIRNVAITAPYMHDGRFGTLEEVIDFYNEGIQAHPNLDDKLKDEEGNPKRMNFSELDKADLVVFLNTLTGTTHLTDESLSNPFKN